jgi:hypothetical protein
VARVAAKRPSLRWDAGLARSETLGRPATREDLTFYSRSFHCISDGEDPKLSGDLLGTPFQYFFLVYCSFEKLMHQRPNPIPFFFQREMACVEKMELRAGNISLKEFSTLHREDSIVLAPRDQRRGLMFAEVLLPIVENIQISLRVVED